MNKKSKFMLVWILCSIMLIVSVNAQSSKNKGKTKTNQTNSKPIEFDQKEFNLEVEKLPINYLGHNPAELYRRIIDRRKWGGKFWTDGYFVSTVSTHGTEEMIKNYVQQQGKTDSDGQG